MSTRILAAGLLTALLMNAGCTTPDGRFDASGTALLGIGAAAIVGGAVLLSDHDNGRHYETARERERREVYEAAQRRDARRAERAREELRYENRERHHENRERHYQSNY